MGNGYIGNNAVDTFTPRLVLQWSTVCERILYHSFARTFRISDIYLCHRRYPVYYIIARFGHIQSVARGGHFLKDCQETAANRERQSIAGENGANKFVRKIIHNTYSPTIHFFAAETGKNE